MFNINGVEWRIILTSSFHPMLAKSDGSFTLGACDDTLKTIYIRDDLPSKKFKKVLCHEITHAAMYSYNVYLTLEQEELLADLISSYGEEIIIITNKIFKQLTKQGE